MTDTLMKVANMIVGLDADDSDFGGASVFFPLLTDFNWPRMIEAPVQSLGLYAGEGNLPEPLVPGGLFIKDEFYKHMDRSEDIVCFSAKQGEVIAPSLPLYWAEFGPHGPKSRVSLLLALMEFSFSVAKDFIVAIVPDEFLESDDFLGFSAVISATPLVAEIRHDDSVLLIWAKSLRSRYPRPLKTVVNDDGVFDLIRAKLYGSQWNTSLHSIKMGLTRRQRLPHKLVERKGYLPPLLIRDALTEPHDDAVRIACKGTGGGITILALTASSKTKLDMARIYSGERRLRQTKSVEGYALDYMIMARELVQEDDESNEKLDEIVQFLEGFGLRVEVDQQVYNWLEKMRRRRRRLSAPFEQAVRNPANGDWVVENGPNGIRTQYQDIYSQWRAEIDRKIPFPLYDFQKDDLARIMVKGSAIEAAFMGFGKAQPLSEPILTPSGWSQMGDVSVGDHVIGSSGTPVRVSGVFPQGVKEVYEVTFSDGASVRCCKEHLWAVMSPQNRHQGNRVQVKSLEEIMDSGLRDKWNNLKYFVPLVEPVQMDEVSHLIDPYVIGVLLGDGYLGKSTPGLTTKDPEMVEYVQDLLPEGLSVECRGEMQYSILDHSHPAVNRLTDELRRLRIHGCVANEKFVPGEYMSGSVNQRLSVLQGLMDTDGTPTGGYQGSFSSVSKELALQVVELARSLGGTANISSRIPTYTHKGVKKNGQRSYRVQLRLPEGMRLFQLDRKQIKVGGKGKPVPTRSIVSIEPVGAEECQCIQVDSDDSLYVTKDYVLTHNTRVLLARALLTGDKHLAILESKLIRELKKEVKKVGFPEHMIKEIKTADDVKDLKLLNIITYNRVWKQIGTTMRVRTKTKKGYATDVFLVNEVTGETDNVSVLVKRTRRSGHSKWVYDELPAGYQWPKSKATGEDVIPRLTDYKVHKVDVVVEAPGEPAKTLAHVLRKVRFNSLIIDEAHRLKGGKTTKQGRYAQLIRAKHVICMTGTVLKSYPRNIYALIVRTFGQYTIGTQWGYDFPVPSSEDFGWINTPTRDFANKYVQMIYMTDTFKETLEKGKKSREVPMVPDDALDDWYTMISSSLIRRRRREPDVCQNIKIPEGELVELEYDCDDKLTKFYYWWLDKFAEWFAEQVEAEKGGSTFDSAALLVQLNKLRFASVVPQSPKVNIEGVIEWDGGLTPRQSSIVNSIVEMASRGERAIVFTETPDLIRVFQEELAKREVLSVPFHSKILPMKVRLDNLERFKSGEEYTALLMSRGCGQTGYNIPEADVIWNADWNWTPADMEQAEARMLRSTWFTEDRIKSDAKPMIYRTVQMGTIDEYMRQLVEVKSQGIGQAIDRSDVSFNFSQWRGYRAFSEQMLMDLGKL